MYVCIRGNDFCSPIENRNITDELVTDVCYGGNDQKMSETNVMSVVVE